MRKSKDYTFIKMAEVLSQCSTCLDKQVGCILTNSDNIVISSGYNGSPKGYKHCSDLGYCVKDQINNPSACLSIHAEQNALIQCRVPEQIYTCYTTLSPCITCVKMLMNTPCTRIVFLQEHKHDEPKIIWKGEWVHYDYHRNV